MIFDGKIHRMDQQVLLIECIINYLLHGFLYFMSFPCTEIRDMTKYKVLVNRTDPHMAI